MFCLAENACEVRFDKKARPYLVCKLCHTRCFLRSLEAVRGLAICPTLIAAAIERRKGEPAFRAWFDGEIGKTITFVNANALTPPVRAEHLGLAAEKTAVPFSFDVSSGAT
jgi:hypothetical protein